MYTWIRVIQSNVALGKKQHKILDDKIRDLQIQITAIHIKLVESTGPRFGTSWSSCYSTSAVIKATVNGQNQILRHSEILVNSTLHSNCYVNNIFYNEKEWNIQGFSWVATYFGHHCKCFLSLTSKSRTL